MNVARLKSERGQAFVLAAVAMVMCMGMAALVLDVGNWFRDKRRLQGTVDAAALAGAQQLPDDSAGAQSMALTYANKNGGDVAGANIVVTSQYQPSDTITVNGQRNDPGIFSKVIAIPGANITAKATARVGPPAQALHVAPMVVFCGHSLIQNCNNNHTPQFNVPTTMDYDPMALTYANKNGGDVAGANIVVTSQYQPSDTITVNGQRNDPGIFSKVIAIPGANITAKATARVGPPAQALHVAPMVVFCGHSLIQNCNNNHTPQFNVPTTMDYDPMGAPGAFGMLDLDGESGAIGASTEAAWITDGFDKYLGLGKYKSDPGAKFGSQNVQGALDDRLNTVLLFPVFKTLDGTGSNADYDIIGWIGFYLQSYDVHGNSATLHGYFTQYIAEGILSQHSPGSGGVPSSLFGVKAIQLVE